MSQNIAIIGSGVVGLTTAVACILRGHRVAVLSSPPGPHTIASRVAPALFTPYPGPIVTPRFEAWTIESLQQLRSIATLHAETSGVFTAHLREYFYSPRVSHPFLDKILETTAIPAPQGIEAVVGDRIHIDTLLYMNWLEARAKALGVVQVPKHIDSFSQVKDCDAIVNCTGLGARQLVQDPQLAAMRGVVVHIPNEIGLNYSLHDDAPQGRVAYIFKFKDHLVLGGTFDQHHEDLSVESDVLPGILDRCRELLRIDRHPRWQDISFDNATRTLVALRPTRIGPSTYEDIRLEIDRSFHIPVIHNYGHGRQGISMSWGTAAEAASLVESVCG